MVIKTLKGGDAEGKLPLTLSVIAHNEERNLRRCLQSAVSLCAEIVIVVNDCTDNTEVIAKEFGARVFNESWHGHRDQKNIALSKATQPWIYCIDADEEISPELATSIRSFIESDGCGGANGAYSARKVWFLGRWILHGDWYPDYCLRLVRRGTGKWAGSREHDKMEVKGSVKKLQGDLFHYSNPTLNSQIQKINYFSDIYLQRQLDDGKQWSLVHALFRPVWRFVRAYFLRFGFLDGFPGLYIAVLTAFAAFVRHSRLYEYMTTAEVRERFKPNPRLD